MNHLLQTKQSLQFNKTGGTSIVNSSKTKSSLIDPIVDLKFVGRVPSQIIHFSYNKSNSFNLQNRDLILKNESSSYYISFKIQCNHPNHYKVHPSTAQIPPKKTIQIIIKINDIQEAVQLGPVFFLKFASDKFRIQWYSYHESERNYYRNSVKRQSLKSIKSPLNQRVFSVHIDIEEEQQMNQNTNIRKCNEVGELVAQTMQLQKRELQRLQNLIIEKQMQKGSCGYLSCWTVVILSMMAFIAGILLPL